MNNIGVNKMPETKTKKQEEKVLKIADRCDRCGAQAFVLATGVSGELLFCGHHYHKYEYAITQWAYKIVNELDTINEKSASSNI
jgi:transcription elongation factor Elf1